jgi:ribonucleoside-triphosphate reductase (thioredoxin)
MIGKDLLSELKFKEAYAKFRKDKMRMETWEESAEDVMDMHYNKFKDLDTWNEIKPYFDKALNSYKEQKILASQRNLQFRGNQVNSHNVKLYNCSTTYVDRPEVFKEIMYVLLCGAGVGFSVERRFVDKLPTIKERKEEVKTYTIPDSIEGWSLAIDELMNSFFNGTERVVFDYSLIREKGSLIGGEFVAPGPEGLKQSIEQIENLIKKKLESGENKLTTLNSHDIICMLSDAVLSGGVRRSALISLFDKDDNLMIQSKTGQWWIDAPWRARANNSVKLLKNELTKEEFDEYKQYIMQFGEPGIILVDNIDAVYNPCCEIGFIPRNPQTGKSCFQFCNLNEIIGSHSTTAEEFYKQCETASILGTFQAAYTDFPFLGTDTEELTKHEALIGVSITGIMNNPDVLLDPEILEKGATIVKETNEKVAKLLGINQAARTTCVKPSGNSCLTFDSIIKTNKGNMSLSDIFDYCSDFEFNISSKNLQKDDSYIVENTDLKVYDENNDLQDITGLYFNGLSDVYEIEFEDGIKYEFTGNHKLKTTNGWKYVRDLNEDDDIISF